MPERLPLPTEPVKCGAPDCYNWAKWALMWPNSADTVDGNRIAAEAEIKRLEIVVRELTIAKKSRRGK
jgi:hypothetical protein